MGRKLILYQVLFQYKKQLICILIVYVAIILVIVL